MFKDQVLGIIGQQLLGPFLKALKGSFNGLIGNKSGDVYGRSIHKFIAAAGDPKIVPASVTPTQRAELVVAAGNEVVERLRAAIVQVEQFRDRQATREITRGTPGEAEALAAREQEERDVQAAFKNLLGEVKL